jgi:hypothetical protein
MHLSLSIEAKQKLIAAPTEKSIHVTRLLQRETSKVFERSEGELKK